MIDTKTTYLGNPFFIQRNKIRDFQGNWTKLKIEPKSGKKIHVKCRKSNTDKVSPTIYYTMSTFKAPISVC